MPHFIMGKTFKDKKEKQQKKPDTNEERLRQWDEAYPKGSLVYDLVEEVLEEDDEP